MINDNNTNDYLSDEETFFLFKQMKEGSKQAREKLIIDNMGLVMYIVNKYFITIDCDKDELISAGKIGLINAINTFDLSKKYKFSTYAFQCIKNEISMFLRHMKRWQNIIGLDDIIVCNDVDGSEVKYIDILPSTINIEQEYDDEEMKITIKNILDEKPNDMKKEIVLLHFGFYDDKCFTQKEIATMMKVTKSYVSSVIINFVKILKNDLENDTNKQVKKNNCIKILKK